MSGIVDPSVPLADFEVAIKRKLIKPTICKTDRSLFLHFDQPMGNEFRLTFARIENSTVTAFLMVAPGEPYKGLNAFSVGVATHRKYRRQGRAKEIIKAAIEELKYMSQTQGVDQFYMDAVVSVKNIASQKLSESVFQCKGVPVTDHASGEAALQYFLKVSVSA